MPETVPDTVTIASAALEAEIALLGAELVRLDTRSGESLLWNGDPAFWNGRAPLLFPIVGTLAGGRFRHGGKDYALPRHGFARRSRFAIVDRCASEVTLRLEASDETRAVWPFAFRLDVTHALDGARLTTTAAVTNLSDETMPTSFGFHPAFRRPLPGAGPAGDHVVRFAKPEPAPVRRLDADGLVDPAPRPTPVAGDRLPIDDALFFEDALIFDALASRSLTFGTDAARLAVAFDGMPHLGLWSKPGAPFLCIEPWQGHSDPAGFTGTLAEKPGTVAVLPGETRRFAMSVALER